MNRTQLQAMQLHLIAVENFLYKHKRELPVDEVNRLHKQTIEMLKLLDAPLSERRGVAIPESPNGRAENRGG